MNSLTSEAMKPGSVLVISKSIPTRECLREEVSVYPRFKRGHRVTVEDCLWQRVADKSIAQTAYSITQCPPPWAGGVIMHCGCCEMFANLCF